MNICKTLILSLILTSTLTFSALAGEAPQYVFQIPEYPGTEAFASHSSSLTSLHYPFATILRIYQTKDHSSLDKEKVIKFFKKSLMMKDGDRVVTYGRTKNLILAFKHKYLKT